MPVSSRGRGRRWRARRANQGTLSQSQHASDLSFHGNEWQRALAGKRVERAQDLSQEEGRGTVSPTVSSHVPAPPVLGNPPLDPLHLQGSHLPSGIPTTHVLQDRPHWAPGTKAAAERAGLGRREGKVTQPAAGAPPTTLTKLTLWTILVFPESWPKYLSLGTLSAFLPGRGPLSLLQ